MKHNRKSTTTTRKLIDN